jgi:hypothetical protein
MRVTLRQRPHSARPEGRPRSTLSLRWRENGAFGAIQPSVSNIVKQSHETEVHVQLLMAMKQGRTRIIRYKVHFGLLIAS